MTEENRQPTPDESAGQEPAREAPPGEPPAAPGEPAAHSGAAPGDPPAEQATSGSAAPGQPDAPDAPGGPHADTPTVKTPPAGQGVSTGQGAPAGQNLPAGQNVPTGQGMPAGQNMPTGQGIPAGQSMSSGQGMPPGPAGPGMPGAPGMPMGQGMPGGPGAPGERVLFGSAFASHPGGLGTPPQQTSTYPSMGPPTGPIGTMPRTQQPSIPQQRRGHTALIAGMTVLALLVGGGAGAAGGYLVAENNQSGPVTNALDQEPPAKQTSAPPSGSVESVAEKVLPVVVQLQVRGRSTAGEGSGFVISSDGLIVTNNHVVEGAVDSGQIVAVFHDGSTAQAQIVGRDPTSDVAVVRAEGKSGLPTAQLGRSDDLRVGQSVVAIGSPFELSGTVTSGIVSSLHRPTRAGGEDGSQATVMDAIQTDAAINPGNSGGPLVNMNGQVIGINSAIYSPTGEGESQGGSVGIGFSIPIDQARRTADEIVKTGKATQTILGVTVQDGDDGGARIVDVTADGPGAQAGLKKGDVVTKLDDRTIETSDALVAAVRSYKPGDKVRLQLGDGSRNVEATLAGQQVETE